jgi:hypothetical protein
MLAPLQDLTTKMLPVLPLKHRVWKCVAHDAVLAPPKCAQKTHGGDPWVRLLDGLEKRASATVEAFVAGG